MKEFAELQADPHNIYAAWPADDDNMFEWHFTVRGPEGTAFEGGIYHGRILLPVEYPFKPPNIIFLTVGSAEGEESTNQCSDASVRPIRHPQANGRFEVGKKICLSVTGHHPEFWRPSWGSGFRQSLVCPSDASC